MAYDALEAMGEKDSNMQTLRITLCETLVLFAVAAAGHVKEDFNRELIEAFGRPLENRLAGQLHYCYACLMAGSPGAFRSGHKLRHRRKAPMNKKFAFHKAILIGDDEDSLGEDSLSSQSPMTSSDEDELNVSDELGFSFRTHTQTQIVEELERVSGLSSSKKLKRRQKNKAKRDIFKAKKNLLCQSEAGVASNAPAPGAPVAEADLIYSL